MTEIRPVAGEAEQELLATRFGVPLLRDSIAFAALHNGKFCGFSEFSLPSPGRRDAEAIVHFLRVRAPGEIDEDRLSFSLLCGVLSFCLQCGASRVIFSDPVLPPFDSVLSRLGFLKDRSGTFLVLQ